MTQKTKNIKDNSNLTYLYQCGLDEAINDLKAGRVKRFESIEELFKDLGI